MILVFNIGLFFCAVWTAVSLSYFLKRNLGPTLIRTLIVFSPTFLFIAGCILYMIFK
jgi:hypothetical protein